MLNCAGELVSCKEPRLHYDAFKIHSIQISIEMYHASSTIKAQVQFTMHIQDIVTILDIYYNAIFPDHSSILLQESESKSYFLH